MDPETIQWTINHRKDLYTILGVSPHADKPTLQRAYRRLMLLTHPDKVQGEAAHEACLAIMFAYDVLSDTHRRQLYDLGGFDAVESNSQLSIKKIMYIIVLACTQPLRHRAGTQNETFSAYKSEGGPDGASGSPSILPVPLSSFRITWYMFLTWSAVLAICGLWGSP